MRRKCSRLKMPVGLDGPDTKQALEIPALNEPEVPRDPQGACLEEPPMLDTSSLPPGGTQFDLPARAGSGRALRPRGGARARVRADH